MSSSATDQVGPLRILYVEDDDGLARLFKRKLERLGHQIEVATTGEEGVTLFAPQKYDAIVLDYRLPGMSGLDVLAKIAPINGDPPVILLTAGGDENLAVEALNLGAADYLVKDVNQIYFDLLPSVLDAAVMKVRLREKTERQQDDLHYYVRQLEAEIALRKESELRLKENEERLQLALFGTTDGIYDWDLSADTMYFSPRWLDQLGYLPGELAPHKDAAVALVNPDDVPHVMDILERFMSGEVEKYHAIFRMKHKSGSWVWILSRANGIRDENGRVVRMIGAHTDITEMKKLELDLAETYEKAQAANIAKTDFLANMSHEIRTPMNAVIGLANILSRSNPLTDQQKEFIGMLQLAADSLLALINDLLDISKIESRTVELEQIPFKPAAVIEEIVSMLQVKAIEKHLEFTYEAKGQDDYTCLGDPTRFRQIILNLCSNALKFTETGGVHVTVERSAKARADGRHDFLFRVRDTGIGIASEKLEGIFEKFIQADLSITRRYGGSGLGLAITKTLVDLMGGSIEIESLPGLGSVFTVKIAFACENEEAGETSSARAEDLAVPTPTAPAPSQARVLVVEDLASNRLVVTTFLKEFGYAYDIAVSGDQAVSAVKRHAYGVILMDVAMHGMDGMEATKQIRAWEKTSDRPKVTIIGMTAHALTGDREKCLKVGMDDYLAKPFSPNELQRMLAEYLQAEVIVAP